MVFRLVCHRLRAGKVFLPDDDRNFFGVLCQKYSLFRRRKSAADDEDIHSREKFPVTGGTVGDTASLVFPFSHKAQLSGIGTHCQNNARSTVLSFVSFHRPDISVQINSRNLSHGKFRAKGFRLSSHLFRQLSAVRLLHAGIVDNLRCNGDLPSHFLLFQDEDPVFCPRRVEGGR